MMLAAVDIAVPYRRLLSLLDVAPWGTPHSRLLRLDSLAPEVEVIYQQGELSDLFDALDAGFPPAVFVWTGDLPYWQLQTPHAVVLCGYDDQNFFINDPAFDAAPQVAAHGDLDLAWLAGDSYFALLRRKT